MGTNNAEGAVSEGVTITATFTNDRVNAKTSATVKKVWDDEGNLDKLRPASITVTLSNGVTVTLSEENEWTATITELPKYDADGKLIEYIWTEGNMPEGYVLASTSVDGTVTTLTNAHKREEIAGNAGAGTAGGAGGTSAKAGETKAAGAKVAGLVKTADDALPAWPLAILAIASLAMLIVARKKQRDC